MKRGKFLATTYALLVMFCSRAGGGAALQPGSPEAVVSEAVNAENHGRVDEFVSAMHPDSLKEFRSALLPTIDAAAQRVGEAKVLATFPGVKTVKELKALDAPRLFAGVVRRMSSYPEIRIDRSARHVSGR